jgi:hypothetical protein
VQTAIDRRFKKRVPCRFSVPGGSYSGMVLNVSRGGMFVQTSAAVSPGDAVHIELAAGDAEPLGVDARVVWRRVVAPRLRTVSTGGMGVHIQYACDAYFGFLAQLAALRPAEAAAEHAPERPAYRVRLLLAGSTRSRSLLVEAEDEAEARERAAALAGPGWIVLAAEASSGPHPQ